MGSVADSVDSEDWNCVSVKYSRSEVPNIWRKNHLSPCAGRWPLSPSRFSLSPPCQAATHFLLSLGRPNPWNAHVLIQLMYGLEAYSCTLLLMQEDVLNFYSLLPVSSLLSLMSPFPPTIPVTHTARRSSSRARHQLPYCSLCSTSPAPW